MTEVQDINAINELLANEDPITQDEKRKLALQEDSSDKHVKITSDEESNDQKGRKKPGRKPATSEPTNKRVAQNRAAQRAFRERKENYVKILESKIEELERAHQEAADENKRLQEKLVYFEEKNGSIKNGEFTFKVNPEKLKSVTDLISSSSIKSSPRDSCPALESGDSSSPSSKEKSYSPIETKKDLNTFLTDDTPLISDNSTQQPASLPQSSPFDFYGNPMLYSGLDYMLPAYTDPLSANLYGGFNTNVINNGSYDPLKDPYNSAATLGFDPSLAAFSGVNNQSFDQMNMYNFDPIMLADHILAYDPLGSALGTSQGTLPQPIAQGQQFLDQQYKEYLDHNPPPKEEFDLDNLCSLMKEKATCTETKKFLTTYCDQSH